MTTRRRFVGSALALASVALVTRRASAAASGRVDWLQLTSIHTQESARVTFRADGRLESSDVVRLEQVCRDYRVGERHTMDPGLYDQLRHLAALAGREPRFEIISGYRSPATNAKLRAAGHAVAEHSQHMLGHALDIRLIDFPVDRLHELALRAQRGGVGYYPVSNFVHIDTGRVRSWAER